MVFKYGEVVPDIYFLLIWEDTIVPLEYKIILGGIIVVLDLSSCRDYCLQPWWEIFIRFVFLLPTTTPDNLFIKPCIIFLVCVRCEAPHAIVSTSYIKATSEHIKKVLAECNIQTFMKTTNTLRQLLSHPKNCIPLKGKSSVVYSIPCKDCTFTYISETSLVSVK